MRSGCGCGQPSCLMSGCHAVCRELLASPSATVKRIVDEYYGTLPRSKTSPSAEATHATLVGVHLRMNPDPASETPGLPAPAATKLGVAIPFRLSCHYRYFVEAMKAMPKDTRFFVAADSTEALEAIRKVPQLRGRVFSVPGPPCVDRAAPCIATATASLLLLSKTREMMSSRWRCVPQPV